MLDFLFHPLFGGFGILDFLDHPSWAPVDNFCRKTARNVVFRQKLVTAAHESFAPFFGRNWPPGPMMGDPKNQGCHFLNAPPNNADFLIFFDVF